MIYIVQYIAGQHLAFKIDSSNLNNSNNDILLKLVEVIGKLNQIMMEYLSNIRESKFQDLNENKSHYLNNHFQKELIHLLSKSI